MIAELKETQDYLKEKGICSPRTEAEYILSHLLNCRKIDLYIEDTGLSQFQRQQLHKLVEQRISGEPLQYILGETEFYGFKFKVTKGVFIPRPETEILIDTVLRKLRTPNSKLRTNILDLCTGCGNIAISLTKMLSYYKLFASDISEKAVVLACENARLNEGSENFPRPLIPTLNEVKGRDLGDPSALRPQACPERMRRNAPSLMGKNSRRGHVSSNTEFRCGDLFKPWEDKGEFFFDIIVCNPPYIKTKELKNLPHDVKNEPTEALDGGEDGLTFYRRVLQEGLFYLKEKGYIFVEIGPDVAEGVKHLLDKDFFNIEIIKDHNNRARVISGRRK